MWTKTKGREYAIINGGCMGNKASKMVSEEKESEALNQDRVVLVDIEQMHRSDVLTLKRRVDAANTRITAECTDLRAVQYGPFQPEVMLGQYDAIERQVRAAKALLMRTACIALGLLVLCGCCECHDRAQTAPVPVATHAGGCVDGHCLAR